MKEYCNIKNKKYDIIIRLRPDLRFVNVTKLFLYYDENLHTYNGYRFGSPSMNDQVAYGNFYNMKTYFNLFDNFNNYYSVHPESLLGIHLEKNNINVSYDWNVHYNLIRE